jgi:hypothetical protein
MTTVAEPAVAPKPSYLGLVNAIAVAEGHGHRSFTDWADRTADPDMEAVLRLVAAREGEHSSTFARRVVELGYRVRPRPLTEEEEHRAEVAASDHSDLEKLLTLGYGKDAGDADTFDGYFRDHSIDPTTCALLGRFIGEERDSARMLRQACVRLQAAASSA